MILVALTIGTMYGRASDTQGSGANSATLGAPKPPAYLYAGQTSITIITDPQTSVPNSDSIGVLSSVNSKGKCDDTAIQLPLTGSSGDVTNFTVRANGINTLTLKEGLKKGTYVCFYRSVQDGSSKSSASALQPVLDFIPPKFDPDPVAGVTSISVIATPTDAKNTGTTEVRLLIVPVEDGQNAHENGKNNGQKKDEKEDQKKDEQGAEKCDPNKYAPVILSGNKLTATTDDQGIATLTLANALQEGSRVCAYQKFTTASGAVVDFDEIVRGMNGVNSQTLQATKIEYVYDTLDWGRVRAYFAAGALIAQDQSNFSSSSASQFLLFNLEKTWLMPGCSRLAPWKPSNTSRVSGCAKDSSPGVPGINTFFQTRLTSIPVQTPVQTGTTGSSTTGSSSNTARANASSATTSSASSGGDLSSQKTARLEVGAYAPWILTHWYYDKQPNALFFGPLLRAGFDTLTGSTAQTVSSAGSPLNVNFERFYNHYGAGLRIGHYGLTHSDNKAPEILSYLDVVFGPYTNLQSYVCLPNKGVVLPGSGCASGLLDSRTDLYRMDLEGILKIPRTVMFVGFNANVKALSRKNLDLNLQPNDDLRFLFGIKLDIASVMQKLGVSTSSK
jgi:hypothetical protein